MVRQPAATSLVLLLVGLVCALGRSLPKHRKVLRPNRISRLKHLADDAVEEDIYEQEWVKEAVRKAKKTERERWAMFDDDGLIKTRRLKNPCEDLKQANNRVKTYPPAVKHIPLWNDAVKGNPRILCWVFSNAAFHKTRAEAVRLTWGKRCDGLLFFSNLADPAMNAVLLTKTENDAFDNLWHKMSLALQKLAEDYMDDYDWFYKGDDDTYLLVENLRRYLLSDDVKSVQVCQIIEPQLFTVTLETGIRKWLFCGASYEQHKLWASLGGCRERAAVHVQWGWSRILV